MAMAAAAAARRMGGAAPWRALLARTLRLSAAARDTLPIRMPALSPTMEKGNIVEWKKSVGDRIEIGDVLFEVETDKAVMGMESNEEGYLAEIILKDGASDVPLNKLVALMVEEEGEEAQMPEEDEAAPASDTADKEKEAPASEEKDTKKKSGAKKAPSADAGGEHAQATKKPLSPAVRALLGQHGLSADSIPATGPKGHLLKGDVLRFLEEGGAPAEKPKGKKASKGGDKAAPAKGGSASGAAPAPSGVRRRRRGDPHEDVPVSGMRKVIASRLTESKSTLPHAYVRATAHVDRLLSLRKQLIDETGKKFSVNDAIVKAASLALRAVPEVNTVVSKGEPTRPGTVDISVAVATPTGLITPIITNADARAVGDISSAIAELAGKARDGKLAPHEYQGGTFTISNLGMFGVSNFTAVINPPQTCILAVGGTRDVLRNGAAIKVLDFQISADSRFVSQDVASRWLKVFTSLLENPETLLADHSFTKLEDL